MLPDPRFLRQPKHFWANVRTISQTISQEIGYTQNVSRKKGEGSIRVPTVAEITQALRAIQLSASHLVNESDARLTPLGERLLAYFEYRAEALNTVVSPLLMDAEQARVTYEKLISDVHVPGRTFRPPPMNKQKGEKKTVAFLTAIINLLLENTLAEEDAADLPCDFDPHVLTTATRDGAPLRTLARRVDGAFPGTVNPVAVWEIKEYYYTTTFGSHVADGVYETLLDGLELEELRAEEDIDIKHHLMIDSRYTWWTSGKSYLCHIIDMLHMGYADEVLFGSEVITGIPRLVRQWVALERNRISPEPQPMTQ